MQNEHFLFLDDIREPADAGVYTNQPMFTGHQWQVVRSYTELVAWIEANGLPRFISFDHDLADSHYTPEHLWTDYSASKAWQDAQVHTEKTGYECAQWLVNYCTDKDLPCPGFYCHSKNTVGKDKIVSLMTSFRRNQVS